MTIDPRAEKAFKSLKDKLGAAAQDMTLSLNALLRDVFLGSMQATTKRAMPATEGLTQMLRYYWLLIGGKWRFAEKRPNGVMLVWYEEDDDMAEYLLTFRGEWVWKMGNKRRRNDIGLKIDGEVEIHQPPTPEPRNWMEYQRAMREGSV